MAFFKKSNGKQCRHRKIPAMVASYLLCKVPVGADSVSSKTGSGSIRFQAFWASSPRGICADSYQVGNNRRSQPPRFTPIATWCCAFSGASLLIAAACAQVWLQAVPVYMLPLQDCPTEQRIHVKLVLLWITVPLPLSPNTGSGPVSAWADRVGTVAGATEYHRRQHCPAIPPQAQPRSCQLARFAHRPAWASAAKSVTAVPSGEFGASTPKWRCR